MKKITSTLLVIGAMTILLGGCTKTEEASVITEPAEVEISIETPVEEERAPIEVDFTDKSFSEMNAFIELHKSNAIQDEKDEMVLAYDERLRETHKELIVKYENTKYFTAINETKDEQYVLHLDQITDATIKTETLALMDAGFGFQMLEGSYYLVIDYVKVNSMFKELMSENLANYYTLRSNETETPVTVEEYLNISFDEVYNRVLTLETFIKDNPNFRFKEDATNWLNWYISSLLSVNSFSGAVDYETGFVSEKIKDIYDTVIASELIIAKEAVVEMQAVITSYDCIIKWDNEEAMDAVNQVRNKYYLEVAKLVEAYYPAK